MNCDSTVRATDSHSFLGQFGGTIEYLVHAAGSICYVTTDNIRNIVYAYADIVN